MPHSSNLDSRFRVVGVGSLQIENVQPQDAGSYMCRAENKEDSLDASATLTVLGEENFFFFVFLKHQSANPRSVYFLSPLSVCLASTIP